MSLDLCLLRPKEGPPHGKGAPCPLEGRWGVGVSRGACGEVWRDDPCLLTVPTEWKDEVPDLKQDIRNSRIKLSCTDQIPLFHVDLFQC